VAAGTAHRPRELRGAAPQPSLGPKEGRRALDAIPAASSRRLLQDLSGKFFAGSRRTCLERARQTLEWALAQGVLLDIALNHLTLGRARLGLALTASGDDRTAGLAQAAESLDRAVDGVRRAGTEHHIPRGFLARAAFRRFRSDFAGAAADLAEALEIAERGPMRLHESDAHLEWARLCRDQGDLAAARRHVARAREMVEETGYGRRAREVEWLEGTVGSAVRGRAG